MKREMNIKSLKMEKDKATLLDTLFVSGSELCVVTVWGILKK